MSRRNANKTKGYPSPVKRGRSENPLKLTANSIEQLKSISVDASLGNILSKLNAEISIKVGPSGTTIEVLNKETKNTAMTMTDLQKIGGMNTFINKEKKTTISSAIGEELRLLIFRLHHKSGGETKPRIIDGAILQAVRELDIRLRVLDANAKTIAENINGDEGAKDYKDFLSQCVVLSRNAVCRHAIKIMHGISGTVKLADTVFATGLSAWVFNKLSQTKLVNYGPGTYLGQFFFPNDPSKGMSLSVKEWRDENLVKKMSQVLERSRIPMALARSDKFIRALGHLKDDLDLGDETNAVVSEIMRSQMSAIPIEFSHHRFIKLLMARKVGNTKWAPKPRMGSPKTIAPAVGHSILKAIYGQFQTADPIGEYYNVVFPKAEGLRTKTFDSSRNIGHAVNEAYLSEEADEFMNVLDRDEGVLRKWLHMIMCRELAIPEKGGAGAILAEILGLNPDTLELRYETEEIPAEISQTGEVVKKAYTLTKYFGVPSEMVTTGLKASSDFADVREKLNGAIETERYQEFVKTYFTIKEKDQDKKRTIASVFSSPSKNAKKLCGLIKDHGNTSLARSMLEWFSGFSNTEIQDIVAHLLAAKFDSVFTEVEELAPAKGEQDSGSESDGDSDGPGLFE
jgi:hypothetical protein